MAALLDEQKQYHDELSGELINAGYIYVGSQNLDPRLNTITIYSDRDLLVPIVNPQRTGSDGRAVNKIWVESEYSIAVYDTNDVQKYINLDNGNEDAYTNVEIDASSKGNYDTLAAAVAAVATLSANDVIGLKERTTGNGGGLTGDVIADTGGAASIAEGGFRLMYLGFNLTLQLRTDVINVKQFGAVGDYNPTTEVGTEDHAAIQAAIDFSQGDSGETKKAVFVPAGKYLCGDTVYLELGLHIYGEGHTLFTVLASSRLYAKVGGERDLLRVRSAEDTNQTPSVFWSTFHIHNIDLRGDPNGTIGRGLAFVDEDDNPTTPIDQTKVYDMCIRNFPESNIYIPEGVIPLHIRDIRTTGSGRYGIEVISISLSIASLTLDNISGDDNELGLILLKDLDPSSNVVIINPKSENRTLTHQQYAIICDNCDRASISINGGHNTRRSDHPTDQAPRDFIRITGAGVPVITWNGFATRMFVGDTDIDTSYVLNDTVNGRTIPSHQRVGDYNIVNAHRVSQTGGDIASGASANANIEMNAVDWLFDGDIVAGAQIADMDKVFCGEAIFTGESAGQDIYFQRHNKDTVTWTEAPALLQGFRVPKIWTKASGISAAYNPASIIGPANVTTTVTVNGAALGDFCLITHPADQDSTIATSYVSAADTVTVVWAAASGTRNAGSADLTAYTLREDKLNLINSYSKTLPLIATNTLHTETVTLIGARQGDAIMASFSVDLAGISVFAFASADDTVDILFFNLTGGSLTLGAGILRLGVLTR